MYEDDIAQEVHGETGIVGVASLLLFMRSHTLNLVDGRPNVRSHWLIPL